jgi:membrane-associated HD superfamily phosphohydrolase
MAEKDASRLSGNSRRQGLFWGLLLIVTLGVIYLTLILPSYTRQAFTPLQEGAVTPQDIVAPRSLTYNSEILTQRQREAAASSVLPIYTAPDTSISRRQLEGIRAALAYITNVRADSFATSAQKETDLAALEDIQLDQETAQAILV